MNIFYKMVQKGGMFGLTAKEKEINRKKKEIKDAITEKLRKIYDEKTREGERGNFNSWMGTTTGAHGDNREKLRHVFVRTQLKRWAEGKGYSITLKPDIEKKEYLAINEILSNSERGMGMSAQEIYEFLYGLGIRSFHESLENMFRNKRVDMRERDDSVDMRERDDSVGDAQDARSLINGPLDMDNMELTVGGGKKKKGKSKKTVKKSVRKSKGGKTKKNGRKSKGGKTKKNGRKSKGGKTKKNGRKNKKN